MNEPLDFVLFEFGEALVAQLQLAHRKDSLELAREAEDLLALGLEKHVGEDRPSPSDLAKAGLLPVVQVLSCP